MAAGFIRGVNNYLFHKLTQKGRGQFRGFGVLLYNLQKILDIDSLGFCLGYNTSQFLCGLFQIRLLLFVAFGQPGKPLYTQRPRHTILIKLLNNAVKFANAPLLLLQLALGPLLFGTLCRRLILHDAPYKLVLVILCVGHNTLQVLEYKFFQYHGPDIMGGALFSGAIIRTSVTLLFFCKCYGPLELCYFVGYEPDLVPSEGAYVRWKEYNEAPKALDGLSKEECPHEYTYYLYDKEGNVIKERKATCSGHFEGKSKEYVRQAMIEGRLW